MFTTIRKHDSDAGLTGTRASGSKLRRGTAADGLHFLMLPAHRKQTIFEVTPMSQSQPTTHRDEIRSWIESIQGHPAFVQFTGKGDTGLLRVDFGEPEVAIEAMNSIERSEPQSDAVDEDEEDLEEDDEDDEELDAEEEADEDDADEDWEDEDEDDDEDEEDDDEDTK
jgi:hypothetical protein